MTSSSVLITDTNIWIDLDNAGILADVFRLPYQFLTPDLAKGEMIQPPWEALEKKGLVLQEMDADQMAELVRLRSLHRHLSVMDLASFLLAKSLAAVLLTGDSRLMTLATTNGLSVHGALWLLDEMTRLQILANRQAAVALERMLEMGARLPRDECRKRLSNWSG